MMDQNVVIADLVVGDGRFEPAEIGDRRPGLPCDDDVLELR